MPLQPKQRGILQKKIRGWCFAGHEEPLTALLLGHVNKSTEQVDRKLNTWQPINGAWGDPDAVLVTLLEEAEDDAKSAGGGTQFYNLEAHFGTGGAAMLSVQFFTKVSLTDDAAGDRELTADMGPSERPESKGLVAMAMRMANERNADLTKKDLFIEKLLHTTILSTLEILSSENKSLRARAEADDARREKQKLREEELLDRAAERRRKDEELSFERKIKEEALVYVKFLIPMVANYLAGEKILPADSPEEMGMAAFFDSLEPQAWAAALAQLPMPHQLMLNARLKKHLDDKARREGTYQGDRPMVEAPGSANGATHALTQTAGPNGKGN